ncbi:MAG: histidine--tRNA ligase [Candidatus Aminicenantes bacterium]|nr:histidine--tRNA ligase [Candidatus Aminicenantes bacterium]
MTEIIAPKGTKDLYLPEIKKWQFIEEQIRQYFSRFLYQEIRTPIFEYTELFYKGTGSESEVVQKEMYTFKDKANRSITLRPENTPSVVRSVLENNLVQEIVPLRFFYIGPMFRYDKPQKGRYRQFHQFGIEVFGDPSAEVDAEVIFSAFGFLEEINIQNIELHINSVGCRQCRPEFLKKLQESAQQKRDELCEDCQRKITTNPLRIFDCKNTHCIEISNHFPKISDYLCPQCHDHFAGVRSALSILEVPFTSNPRLVRGLDYYTRTVFEITSVRLGAQDALLGGGRYDNLFQELGGKEIPATGFAAGIERLILHLDQVPDSKKKIICIVFQSPSFKHKALKLSTYLWKKGFPVFIDYNAKNMKKQFKKCDRIGADYAFIIAEEEISSQSISIKNLKTTEQIQIKSEALDQWLRENI